MDPDGARRLNPSSPSCLNSGAQRTDFFHGLLTAAGRQQLAHKRDEFDRIIFAIHRVLDAT